MRWGEVLEGNDALVLVGIAAATQTGVCYCMLCVCVCVAASAKCPRLVCDSRAFCGVVSGEEKCFCPHGYQVSRTSKTQCEGNT